MALWRTNGYAKTTVADICRAAGVSRALFYFYFPAKEDVLFEVGLLSTRSAQKRVRELLADDYEVESVIAEALRSLERSMARNPRELIIETILEGYRQEHRILAGDRSDDADADMFGELFAKAQQDGKLAATCRCRPICRNWLRCMSARAFGTGPRAATATARSSMWSHATSRP